MTSTASRFSDEVALVTGATSGIGAACARLLAARGARVQLTGRDQDRGSDLNAELRRAGGDTDFVAADLRESGACDRVVEHTLTRFGRIDVLVNSAGIYVAATTPETTDEMWNETLDTNLGAVFWLSRAVQRPMLSQGSGAIVNVASDWGLVGGQLAAAYRARKGGLVLLTRAMALDHAKNGIRINSVCPTGTDTPMMHADVERRGISPQQGARESGAEIPIGRMATANDVAEAVCFLLPIRIAQP